MPPGGLEGLQMPRVSLLIAFQLRGPICLVCFRLVRHLAGMGVPETSVDKYQFALPAKHDVRFARQVSTMEPIPITKAKNHSSDSHFGGGVLAGDSAHVLTSGNFLLCLCPTISHKWHNESGFSPYPDCGEMRIP